MPDTPTVLKNLPGLPRQPLTAAQQLEALRRVQSQAEQRIKLGTQLFKAAEAHATQQKALIDELRQEQQRLRVEVQEDVARSLQSYDQWVGRIDENFTRAMRSLEAKINRLESQWTQTLDRMETMMARAEKLLEQSRAMLESAREAVAARQDEIAMPLEADLTPSRPMRSPLAIQIKLPPKTEEATAEPASPQEKVPGSVSADIESTEALIEDIATLVAQELDADAAMHSGNRAAEDCGNTTASDGITSDSSADPSPQVPPAEPICYSTILSRIRRLPRVSNEADTSIDTNKSA